MGPLVESRSLVKDFPIRGGIFSRSVGILRAVGGVDLFLSRGETVGLVGESGCGKTTFGRCLLRLIEPTRGEVYYKSINILKLKGKELRQIRSKMQIVFQDPFGALDPRQTVLDIVGEPLRVNGVAEGRDLKKRVLELIQRVGLTPDQLHRFPHEFSGGQRQRIGIARGIALNPDLLVLDEPTSSLDVSVQAQVLNLLKDLQEEMRLTYLFISHDLSVIKHMSDRIGVMYLGKILEIGSTGEIFAEPLHPYTKALLSSIPIPDPHARMSPVLLKEETDVPSPINLPSGCRFHTRCPAAKPECSAREARLLEVSDGHMVACHLEGY